MDLVRAHAAAYHAIHEIQKEARVGIDLNVRPLLPARPASPLDRLMAGVESSLLNDFFPRALQSGVLRFPGWFRRLPEARSTQDFLGINYYSQELVSFSLGGLNAQAADRHYPANAQLSETGYMANLPTGLFDMLKWGQKFGTPMII